MYLAKALCPLWLKNIKHANKQRIIIQRSPISGRRFAFAFHWSVIDSQRLYEPAKCMALSGFRNRNHCLPGFGISDFFGTEIHDESFIQRLIPIIQNI